MRSLWRGRMQRRWLFAWVGASVLGVVNGTTRELLYKDRLGESTANQISVATLIGLLALYFWMLQRHWPLATRRDALSVGGSWVLLTILFEFGFGHYVDGDSWEDLLSNYDVSAGNLWPLVLLWIGLGPEAVRALSERTSAAKHSEAGPLGTDGRGIGRETAR